MNNNILYASENKSLKEILFKNFNLIIKSSSKTIDPVITELLTNKPQNLESFLKIWKDKNLYFIKKSKQFVTVKKKNQTGYELIALTDKKNLGFFCHHISFLFKQYIKLCLRFHVSATFNSFISTIHTLSK